MKNLFTFLLCLLLFTQSVWAQSTTACYDFSSAPGIPTPKGGMNILKGSTKKKKPKDMCTPELEKEAKELSDDIRALKKLQNKSLSNVQGTFVDVHNDNKEEIKDLRSERDDKENKRKFLYKTSTGRFVFYNKRRASSHYELTSDERIAKNSEIGEIKDAEDEEYEDLFGSIYMQAMNDIITANKLEKVTLDGGIVAYQMPKVKVKKGNEEVFVSQGPLKLEIKNPRYDPGNPKRKTEKPTKWVDNPLTSSNGDDVDIKNNIGILSADKQRDIHTTSVFEGRTDKTEGAIKRDQGYVSAYENGSKNEVGYLDVIDRSNKNNRADGYLTESELHEALFKSQYFKEWIKGKDESLLNREEEIRALERKQADLFAKAKELCSGKGLQGCPDAEGAFLNSLKDDKMSLVQKEQAFVDMFTTLGAFNWEDKDKITGDPVVRSSVVNLRNYDTEYKEYRSKSPNKGQKDMIEGRKERAENAKENYEWNKANKATVGFEPKPVKTQCGGCESIKKAHENAVLRKNITEQKELEALDDAVGCNVISEPVKDCSELMKKALDKTLFQNDGKTYTSFDQVLDSYASKPTENYNLAIEKVYKQGFSVVVDASQDDQDCGRCGDVEKRLSSLEKEPKFDKEAPAYRTLRKIALEHKCIEPTTEIKKDSTCKDITTPLQELLIADPNSQQKKALLEETMAKVKEFEAKNPGKVCCAEVMAAVGNIQPGAHVKNSSNFALAEAMQCARCGGDRAAGPLGNYSGASNPHVKCGFYKQYLKGKSGEVPNMTRADGSKYTVDAYMKNEVYKCADGPTKVTSTHTAPSELRASDWEEKEYSPEGKFGDINHLNMDCIVLPNGKGELEAVNLSCCEMTRESPRFQSVVDILKQPQDPNNKYFTDKTYNSPDICTDDKCRQDVASKRAESICNDIELKVFDKYKKNDGSEWESCTDYRGITLYKVEESFKMEVKSSGHNTSVPNSSGHEGKRQ